MKRSIFSLLILLALVLSACVASGPAETEVIPTDTQVPEPTNTPEPTEVPPEPTRTMKPTKTQVLTGPLATAQALTNLVTLVPPTAVSEDAIIAADDYVGIFDQAWNIVRANYVRDNFNGVDWDAVYAEYLPKFEAVQTQEEHWALMSDLIAELNDNHSRFVPPENMGAEFGVDTSDSGDPLPGTGLIIRPSREDEQLLIWEVCDFGAGAQAGLQRGDVILAIDGEPVEKSPEGWMGADYFPARFGNGGDQVTLTIQQGPDSEPRDFTLPLGGYGNCDRWFHEIVNTDPYIGYIRILDFDGDAAANILEALSEMEADQPLDGLILDVRHNYGGNSDQSIAIFAQGTVGTTGALREDSSRTVYRIRGPVKWNETTPVVVLTDGNSHSAADYFPAAMKELGRATIIGMPSAGNTEGIISFNLADGTLIRLAISTLLLNDGSSLEGIGVTPDVEVPLGDWGLRQEPFDVQLQAAIEFLGGGK